MWYSAGMNDWPELLLVDKAHGLSSFGVIRELRKKYTREHDGEKAPKMGHAGTLDPLATGEVNPPGLDVVDPDMETDLYPEVFEAFLGVGGEIFAEGF